MKSEIFLVIIGIMLIIRVLLPIKSFKLFKLSENLFLSLFLAFTISTYIADKTALIKLDTLLLMIAIYLFVHVVISLVNKFARPSIVSDVETMTSNEMALLEKIKKYKFVYLVISVIVVSILIYLYI